MMRLMQRRQRDKTAQLGNDAFIDTDRPGIERSTMDNPMAGRDQPILRKGLLKPAKQSRKRILVGFANRPMFVGERLPAPSFAAK